MPAELETMFYYGETPWHGLGTPVEKALTAQEAIVAAGLDWIVDVIPVYHDWKGVKVEIENRVATRRATDGRVLGMFQSDRYTPVQNKEAFGFFDSVVGTGDAKYHTAGSLNDGKKIWMLAKLNGTGPISIKGDEVDKYLLLMNGHDGSLALKMFFTPVRVVCMNTLMAAEAGARRVETFYARHMGNITGKMEQAREILGMTIKFFDKFTEQATKMATLQLPAPQLPKLLAAAFGTTGAIRPENVVNLSDIGSERRVNEMEKVQALFEGSGKGLDNPGIKGTKWAAYNAVVEFVDYAKQVRGDNPDDNRLYSVWLGGGQRIKTKAWDYLVKN